MSKQIKLKSLLKEGFAWERKPGKPLPTIQEVMDEFQAKQETIVKEAEGIKYKVIIVDSPRGENEVRGEQIIQAKNPVELAKILAKNEGYDLNYYRDLFGDDFRWKDIIEPSEFEDEFMPDADFSIMLGEEVFAVCKKITSAPIQEVMDAQGYARMEGLVSQSDMMKLTLKERSDLQRTAKIITESQYKKLLNEDESKNDVISKIPDMVSKIEATPEFDKMVSQISKSPKATKQLMDVLKSYGISPESLNEGVESAAEKLAATFIDKAEDKFKDTEKVVTESKDASSTFGLWLAGLVGGGALGTYISSKFGIFAHAGADLFGNMQNVPEWWVMPAAALAASLLAALGNEVYKAVKGND